MLTSFGFFLYCSFAINPTPIAPMIPGYGALITSLPTYSSIARKTASFSKVPPCTTILVPRESRFDTRITFVNTFWMIDLHNPAMISSGFLPFRCSVIILLFINTVQRLPKTAGFLDANAFFAISFVGICKEDAKFSRNEPHPEEHASFNKIFVITPSSNQIAFISCPPISKIKEASLTYFSEALACATVSTVWQGISKALENSISPYPVVPADKISNSAPASSYRFLKQIKASFATFSGSPSFGA